MQLPSGSVAKVIGVAIVVGNGRRDRRGIALRRHFGNRRVAVERRVVGEPLRRNAKPVTQFSVHEFRSGQNPGHHRRPLGRSRRRLPAADAGAAAANLFVHRWAIIIAATADIVQEEAVVVVVAIVDVAVRQRGWRRRKSVVVEDGDLGVVLVATGAAARVAFGRKSIEVIVAVHHHHFGVTTLRHLVRGSSRGRR